MLFGPAAAEVKCASVIITMRQSYFMVDAGPAMVRALKWEESMEVGTIADLIMAKAADPIATCAAIILATLLAEDATAIIVGILVSQAVLPPMAALAALLAGTIAGDLMLHVAGRYAGDTRWGRSILEKPRAVGSMDAVRSASFWVVGLARFVPGMRLPVYFGSGFLRLDWRGCLAIIALTGCIWTPTLFWLSLKGGDAAKILIDNGIGLSAALAAGLPCVGVLMRGIRIGPRIQRQGTVS